MPEARVKDEARSIKTLLTAHKRPMLRSLQCLLVAGQSACTMIVVHVFMLALHMCMGLLGYIRGFPGLAERSHNQRDPEVNSLTES